MDSFNHDNDEILEEILDESEIETIIDETDEDIINDDDDTIEEATASVDSAKKQAANLKAAKAMGEGGLTSKVSEQQGVAKVQGTVQVRWWRCCCS